MGIVSGHEIQVTPPDACKIARVHVRRLDLASPCFGAESFLVGVDGDCEERWRAQSRIAEEQSVDVAKADWGGTVGMRVVGDKGLDRLVVGSLKFLTCDSALINFLSWMFRYAEC